MSFGKILFLITIVSAVILSVRYYFSYYEEKLKKLLIEEEINPLKNELQKERSTLNQDINNFKQKEEILNNLINETSQSYPWLASLISEAEKTKDYKLAHYLDTKPNPAHSSADKVRFLAHEKKQIIKQCKQYEYQLQFYETLFPWLEDFKEIPPIEAYNLVNNQNLEEKDEYSIVKSYLSPIEYSQLSTAEKYQLALDRYLKRGKSNWEIGIDYERYIGYVFESKGFKVKYIGAIMGREDMGRDLLVYKNNKHTIIQCKRWAQEKLIHEKHIFQLYGSLVQWNIENKPKKAKGLFVTTTALSNTARLCAEYLKIEVWENYPILAYPMIKCHIGKDGEKIYHLPFDQQYDKMFIEPKDGDLYVSTVKEAENLGFRRAYKWAGYKDKAN